MENMLEFNFKQKEFSNSEETLQHFEFMGFRCTDDIMYKLLYVIGGLVGIDRVYISIDEGDTFSRMYFDTSDMAKDISVYGYDDVDSLDDLDDAILDMDVYEKDETDICMD